MMQISRLATLSFPDSVVPSQPELRSLRPSLPHRTGIYLPFLCGNKTRPGHSILRYTDLKRSVWLSPFPRVLLLLRDKVQNSFAAEFPGFSSFTPSKVLAITPGIARAHSVLNTPLPLWIYYPMFESKMPRKYLTLCFML